ncbi:MAG: folate family ECF transporter S component [Clostridia bacterium]|nr:folate family ECF transporter S component [Clostridia bacterium]
MKATPSGIKKLVFMSLFVALTIVCVRFLSIENTIIRISLGFIPLSVSGMTLGALPAGAIALAADVLGMIINSRGGVYFFPFGISEFLYGFSFGFILYKKNPSFIKLSLFLVLQFIIINLALGSLWIYLYNMFIIGTPKTFCLVFSTRTISAAAQLPVQIVVINLLQKYLAPQIKRFNI